MALTPRLWQGITEEWRCPGCARSRRQIMRWTTRYFLKGVGKVPGYKGWMAGLHRHHDHGSPPYSVDGRFPETVVCDQCNAADGAVRRELGLPQEFSFAPQEIARFVTSTPHGRHKVNLAIAAEIFYEVTDMKPNPHPAIRCYD